MRNLFVIQVALVMLGVALFYFYMGNETIIASFYGGGVAVTHTILLSRRLISAGSMANDNPEAGILNLYLGVIQRFIFMLVMFGVGIGILKLNPPAMVGTFALAQVAYMIYGTKRSQE